MARELAAWRERAAQEADKPLQTVIGDATLVEIAKRRPADGNALAGIRGMKPHTSRRHAGEILHAVARGEEAEPISGESVPSALNDSGDGPVIALGEALVRARALEAGLAYELVASRSDLNHVVSAARRGIAEPEVRTLRGWRRELVGAELLELLDGHHALALGPDGRLQVTAVAEGRR